VRFAELYASTYRRAAKNLPETTFLAKNAKYRQGRQENPKTHELLLDGLASRYSRLLT
jgi:hypothetical protein